MKIFGLSLCLVLSVFIIVPAAFASRDNNTVPPVKMPNDFLTAKFFFKGGSVCNCTGEWKTDWGVMNLTQTPDNKVVGEYTYEQGKIEGVMSGNSFSGRWSEAPSYQDPRDGGLAEFEFSEDCAVFKGHWKYGTDGAWKENGWSGQRIQDPQKKLIY